MGSAVTLEQALRSSVFLLMDERRRLESELEDMERRMMAVRTSADAATLDAQMAIHREALAALTAQQSEQEEERRQAAREAAAKAKRAALTGHAATLANEHAALLDALTEAESHAAAMVVAINRALGHEAATRGGATAMCEEMSVETTPLNFNPHETVTRIVGGLCSHLARVSACRMRRLGPLVLLDDPRTRGTAESWRAREATATGPSIEMLIEHAQTQQSHNTEEH